MADAQGWNLGCKPRDDNCGVYEVSMRQTILVTAFKESFRVTIPHSSIVLINSHVNCCCDFSFVIVRNDAQNGPPIYSYSGSYQQLLRRPHHNLHTVCYCSVTWR